MMMNDRTPRVRSFLFASFFTFLVTFSILTAFDLVPENIPEPANTVIVEAAEITEPVMDPNPVVEQYALP